MARGTGVQGAKAGKARGPPAPDIVYEYDIGYLTRAGMLEIEGPVLVSNGRESVGAEEKEWKDGLCKQPRVSPAPNIEQADNIGREKRG
jgi:hypothetical protein